MMKKTLFLALQRGSQTLCRTRKKQTSSPTHALGEIIKHSAKSKQEGRFFSSFHPNWGEIQAKNSVMHPLKLKFWQSSAKKTAFPPHFTQIGAKLHQRTRVFFSSYPISTEKIAFFSSLPNTLAEKTPFTPLPSKVHPSEPSGHPNLPSSFLWVALEDQSPHELVATVSTAIRHETWSLGFWEKFVDVVNMRLEEEVNLSVDFSSVRSSSVYVGGGGGRYTSAGNPSFGDASHQFKRLSAHHEEPHLHTTNFDERTETKAFFSTKHIAKLLRYFAAASLKMKEPNLTTHKLSVNLPALCHALCVSFLSTSSWLPPHQSDVVSALTAISVVGLTSSSIYKGFVDILMKQELNNLKPAVICSLVWSVVVTAGLYHRDFMKAIQELCVREINRFEVVEVTRLLEALAYSYPNTRDEGFIERVVESALPKLKLSQPHELLAFVEAFSWLEPSCEHLRGSLFDLVTAKASTFVKDEIIRFSVAFHTHTPSYSEEHGGAVPLASLVYRRWFQLLPCLPRGIGVQMKQHKHVAKPKIDDLRGSDNIQTFCRTFLSSSRPPQNFLSSYFLSFLLSNIYKTSIDYRLTVLEALKEQAKYAFSDPAIQWLINNIIHSFFIVVSPPHHQNYKKSTEESRFLRVSSPSTSLVKDEKRMKNSQFLLFFSLICSLKHSSAIIGCLKALKIDQEALCTHAHNSGNPAKHVSGFFIDSFPCEKREIGSDGVDYDLRNEALQARQKKSFSMLRSASSSSTLESDEFSLFSHDSSSSRCVSLEKRENFVDMRFSGVRERREDEAESLFFVKNCCTQHETGETRKTLKNFNVCTPYRRSFTPSNALLLHRILSDAVPSEVEIEAIVEESTSETPHPIHKKADMMLQPALHSQRDFLFLYADNQKALSTQIKRCLMEGLSIAQVASHYALLSALSCYPEDPGCLQWLRSLMKKLDGVEWQLLPMCLLHVADAVNKPTFGSSNPRLEEEEVKMWWFTILRALFLKLHTHDEVLRASSWGDKSSSEASSLGEKRSLSVNKTSACLRAFAAYGYDAESEPYLQALLEICRKHLKSPLKKMEGDRYIGNEDGGGVDRSNVFSIVKLIGRALQACEVFDIPPPDDFSRYLVSNILELSPEDILTVLKWVYLGRLSSVFRPRLSLEVFEKKISKEKDRSLLKRLHALWRLNNPVAHTV